MKITRSSNSNLSLLPFVVITLIAIVAVSLLYAQSESALSADQTEAAIPESSITKLPETVVPGKTSDLSAQPSITSGITTDPEISKSEIPVSTLEPLPELGSEILSQFKPDNSVKLSGRLAFSATIKDRSDILILDLDSMLVRVITNGPGNNFYPSWSPDGSTISFTSDRDGNREIYSADWQGRNVRRITNNPLDDDNASWSPDGTKLVYNAETDDQTTNLFTIDLKTGLHNQITNFKGRNTTPRWSPDGRVISFSTSRFWPGWDVCNFNISTNTEQCVLTGRQSYCRPEWSESGRSIVASGGILSEINIGLLDLKTGVRTKLTNLTGREYDGVFLLKDRYVAFVAENQSSDGIFNINLVEIETGKITPLLKAPYSIRYLSWTPIKTLELEAKKIAEEQKEQAVRALAAPVESLKPDNITDQNQIGKDSAE